MITFPAENVNGMKPVCFLTILCWWNIAVHGQAVGPSMVFAHNDYARSAPFSEAYQLGVGYIEADVFLSRGELLVAHERSELDTSRSLAKLYLDPLSHCVKKNGGNAFSDARPLTLMIDLKTDGIPTLDAVTKLIEEYPELTSSRTLRFMISGNVPDPGLWDNYPSFIFFDGRPAINYSPDQWKRIAMVSTNFRSHIAWNGRGELLPGDVQKIDDLQAQAHKRGKKFRFWATPDFHNAWKELLEANVDVLVTDRPAELVDFLAKRQQH